MAKNVKSNCGTERGILDSYERTWLNYSGLLIASAIREQQFMPFPIEGLVETRGSDDTDRLLTQDLMAKLPPNLREPLRLKYFERMNATEIGKELKLCPATVRTRIRTALQVLRCIALERA